MNIDDLGDILLIIGDDNDIYLGTCDCLLLLIDDIHLALKGEFVSFLHLRLLLVIARNDDGLRDGDTLRVTSGDVGGSLNIAISESTNVGSRLRLRDGGSDVGGVGRALRTVVEDVRGSTTLDGIDLLLLLTEELGLDLLEKQGR